MKRGGRRKLWRIRLALFVALLVVAACGPADTAGTTIQDDTVAPSTDDLRVTCGGVNLGGPASVELPDSPMTGEATAAFEEAQQSLGGEDDLLALYTWTIAESSEANLLLFGRAKDVEVAEVPYADASLTNDGSGWSLTSWGQCRILVDAPGYGPSRIVLSPDAEPDPDSSDFDLWIQERACANGEAPVDREVIPVVISDEEQIVVTVLVEPVEGDATCPGNPWHPIAVTLDEPLGTRQILDGITVPPVPLEWPPSQQDLDL